MKKEAANEEGRKGKEDGKPATNTQWASFSRAKLSEVQVKVEWKKLVELQTKAAD